MVNATSLNKPLLPRRFVTEALEAIETPLVQAQTDAIEAAQQQLIRDGLAAVERKDTAAIAALAWNAQITLQTPIYAVWEQGFALGGLHMQAAARAAIPRRERSQFQRFSGIPEFEGNIGRYALAPDVAQLLRDFFNLAPGQLVASAAQAAVLNRAIQLAGNFSTSQINTLKGDLIAAIVPQADTGNPISRDTLLKRIGQTLGVAERRAKNIARTELTTAYNRGRVSMGLRSELLDAFRFIAIDDGRTTDICRSRDGMIIPATDSALLAANTPAMHYQCRSTLSPVMGRVNRNHRIWLNDPTRRAQNRELSDLLPGWR